MNNIELLEREAEQNRARLANTLAELRASITPGNVVDEFVDYADHGIPGEFLHNLKHQVARNPLPAALIGAGIAWLMLSNGRSSTNGSARAHGETLRWQAERAKRRAAEAAERAGQSVGDTVEAAAERARRLGAEAGHRISETAEQWSSAAADEARSTMGAVSDIVGEAGARVQETTSSVTTAVKDTAASAYNSVTDTASRTAAAVSQSAKHIGHSTAVSGRSFIGFCREQPLVLVGLGVALGAAIGALLPSTETEDRLMGDASDETKRRVQNAAEEQYEKVKAVGERGLEAVQQEAEKQGLGGSGESAAMSGDGLDSGNEPRRQDGHSSP